jgi:uncharacterized membrane protein
MNSGSLQKPGGYSMDGLALARALHVLAVVIWIGGVSIVTTALLPAVRRDELGINRITAFQAIERRFAWQARVAIIIVGATGLYMIVEADLWDRFHSAGYWWMHAMVGLLYRGQCQAAALACDLVLFYSLYAPVDDTTRGSGFSSRSASGRLMMG